MRDRFFRVSTVLVGTILLGAGVALLLWQLRGSREGAPAQANGAAGPSVAEAVPSIDGQLSIGQSDPSSPADGSRSVSSLDAADGRQEPAPRWLLHVDVLGGGSAWTERLRMGEVRVWPTNTPLPLDVRTSVLDRSSDRAFLGELSHYVGNWDVSGGEMQVGLFVAGRPVLAEGFTLEEFRSDGSGEFFLRHALEVPRDRMILGRVVDPQGAPVPDAAVGAITGDESGFMLRRSARVQADGYFSMKLPKDQPQADLLVAGRGFVPARIPSEQLQEAWSDLGDVPLSAGASITGELDSAELSYTTLRVRAVVAKVESQVSLPPVGLVVRSEGVWANFQEAATVDADGGFFIHGLADVEYSVDIPLQVGQCALPNSWPDLARLRPSEIEHNRLNHITTGLLVEVVERDLGTPLANIRVTAFQNDTGEDVFCFSDSGGRVFFAAPAGSFIDLTAEDPGYSIDRAHRVEVPQRGVRSIKLAVREQEGARGAVEWVITEGLEPYEGPVSIGYWLDAEQSAEIDIRNPDEIWRGTVRDGRVTWNDAPAGVLSVVLRPVEGWRYEPSAFLPHRERLRIVPGIAIERQIAVERGGRVELRCVDGSGELQPVTVDIERVDGAPGGGGLHVFVARDAATGFLRWDHRQPHAGDRQGEPSAHLLDALRPGEYRFQAKRGDEIVATQTVSIRSGKVALVTLVCAE